MREALIDIALQAGVSLGGQVDACTGITAPISGRFTLDAALAKVLDGAHCRVERAGDGAVVIRPLRTIAPAPVARNPGRPQPAPEPLPPVIPETPVDTVVSEIVVTGQRRAELPARAPNSITAVSGQALQARGEVDAEDLALDVAGMTVTNLGPGRNKVLLRGLSDGVFTGLTQSTVGRYVDNVPITYNAPDPDLRLVDVDRVEVMRGPQGTLYGLGSIGGVVRIVTRRPDLDQWSGSVASSLSTTRSGGGNGDLEGVINAPLIPGRLAIRASGYVERRSGYIDDVALGLHNVNEVSRDGLRVELRAAVTSNWSVSVGQVRQSIVAQDTQYAEAALPPLTRANAVREPHDIDFEQTFATVDGELPWATLTASSARLLHQPDDTYDATPVFGAPGVPAAYVEDRRIEIFVNEITLKSKSQGAFRWLLGLFSSNGENAFEADLTRPPTAATPFYAEVRNDQIDERAIFGEATWQLTPALSVTAGARWFNYHFHTDSLVNQGAAERDFNGSGRVSGFSPKLTVQYRFDDHATVYAQIAEGFRAGGFNTSGLIGQPFDGSLNNPARRYDPDELWNLEAGAKLALWKGRLQLRGALFYAVWKDIQTDQFLSSGLPYTANAGNGANFGLEVEATARWGEHWEARLAALFDDPQLTSASPSFASRIDAGLPGVPSSSGSFGLIYTHALANERSLRIEADTGYVGRSHLTFDAQHLYRMGDYTVTNVSARIEGRRLWGALFADNLFDSGANTFAFGDPFRIGRTVETTPLRPRTIGLRLGAAF